MERSCRTWHSRSVQKKDVFRNRVLSVFCHHVLQLLLWCCFFFSWQIDAFSVSPCSEGIREEPVNPEVIGHRSDEIEMATGLVEHRSRMD